ncbi:MAG: hypothetical protein R3A80_02215 [Bdellovibrionota bacterium]
MPHLSCAEDKSLVHNGPETEEPPKDNTRLPEDERRRILAENLKFLQEKFAKVPNEEKNKPVARTEDVRVETDRIVENKNGEALRTAWTDKIKPVEAEEVVNFTAKQAEEAIKSVMKDNAISDEFAEFTKQASDFEDALKLLDSKGKLESVDQRVNKTQTASVYLEKDPARVAYLAAAFKLRNDIQNQREKATPVADAQNAIDASGANLRSSLNSGLSDNYTHNPLSIPDLASLAGGYLDIAGKQIANARSSSQLPEQDALNLSTPFKGNTNLNKLFENSLNSVNSLDLNNKSLSERIKPFKDLISSKDFLENGSLLLGKENAAALVSAVQAADLLNEASGSANEAATGYLSGAFNLGTGVAAPPCIGCVEIKNSPILDATNKYSASEEFVSPATQEWIDEARELSDNANRNKNMNPKEAAALNKGRGSLEKLIKILTLYKSAGVLNIVDIPSKRSISQYYKNAAEMAAGVLFQVKHRKIPSHSIPAKVAHFKRLKSSASELLEKLKVAKTPNRIESNLRDFFEKSSGDQTRALWRDYEAKNYKKLRSLTAQIIMTRSMAMLNAPYFEQVTVERASLAYLVNRSFESIRERKAKALKAKQLQMGILKLPGIKMADEKEKVKNKNEKNEKNRLPSFTEED